MELIVRLSQAVLVVPSGSQLHKRQTFDAPPAYETVLSSPSSSALEPSSSPSSSHPTLTAQITLKVPSTQTTIHRLTSLTAKLIAFESLAFSNGGFEQSHPINISVRVPIPPQLNLQPGRTYTFSAQLPCPPDMPPSVELPAARLKYKVRVKAKIQPCGSKASWLGSVLPGRTLTSQTDLLVVQAAQLESFVLFSTIKYVSIDGLGSTCISMAPSPCVVGESTMLNLSFADSDAKAKISNVELDLIQDSYIQSRQRSCSTASRQHKPRRVFQLQSTPTASQAPCGASRLPDSVSKKGRARLTGDNLFEAAYQVPDQADAQPSTIPGSKAAIHVSHYLQLTIHFVDAEQLKSYTCAWPITLAHPEAVSFLASDDLPAYTPLDLYRKACTTQSSLASTHRSVDIVQ